MNEEYHSLSRELYGEPFAMFLDYMGFSHYGTYEMQEATGKDKHISDTLKQRLDENYDYSDDVFEIHPFCWCNVCDGEGKEGETCPRYKKPNFHYKPKDFKLNWYKYPIRSNDTNKDITPLEFLEMINDCVRSFYD